MKKLLFVQIFLFSGSLFLSAQLPGDVNTDQGIDIVDALLVAQYYVGLNPVQFSTFRVRFTS